jgi:acyl carrier protein
MTDRELQSIMFAELHIDSYSFQKVLVGLNERTGIEIPESDYGQLNTLAGMLNYLRAHLC